VAHPTYALSLGFENQNGPRSAVALRGYTDISTYFRGARITYGRNTKIDRFRSGVGMFKLDNADRRFDPLYQAGPYNRTYLSLPGSSGNYAATADSAATSITGDFAMVMRVRMSDFTPASTVSLCGKWNTAGNQRSWRLRVNTTGNLVFEWSNDGAATLSATSSIVLPATNDEWIWIGCSIDVNNGAAGRDVKFYYLDGEIEDIGLVTGFGWALFTQLGATQTSAGVTSIFNSDATALTIVGQVTGDAAFWAGRVGYFAIYAAQQPSLSASEDVTFQQGWEPGDTTNEGWTIIGASTSVVFEESRVQPLIPVKFTGTHNGTTHTLFCGFAESWNQTYEGPNQGWMTLRALDPLEVLNSYELPDSPYEYTVLQDAPDGYWPLTERGGTRANDKSGNDYHGTYRKPVTNAQTLVKGDRNGAKHFSGVGNGVEMTNTAAFINVDASDWAVELWVRIPTINELAQEDPAYTATNQVLFMQGGTMGTHDTICIYYVGANGILTPGQIVFHYRSSGVTYNQNVDHTLYSNSLPLHIVFGKRSGSTFIKIDDATPTLASTLSFSTTTAQEICIGGNVTETTDETDCIADIQHVAIYKTGLSATRATEHFTVGEESWDGDTASERVIRILDMIGIPDEADWRAIDSGGEVLGPTSFREEETALDYLHDVEVSEQGMLYCTPAGVITFKNRTNTAATPTNNHTFADSRTSGTDLPYLNRGFGYKWNRDLIVNRVKITDDESGAVTIKESATSIRKYGVRSRAYRRGMAADDAALQALADTLLANMAGPIMQLDDVRINPADTPPTGGTWTSNGLWAAVLGLAINEGITIQRTPQGVGSEISLACRVQGWTFDIEPKSFQAQVTVSEV
jgi:hypothetical protein